MIQDTIRSRTSEQQAAATHVTSADELLGKLQISAKDWQ